MMTMYSQEAPSMTASESRGVMMVAVVAVAVAVVVGVSSPWMTMEIIIIQTVAEAPLKGLSQAPQKGLSLAPLVGPLVPKPAEQ